MRTPVLTSTAALLLLACDAGPSGPRAACGKGELCIVDDWQIDDANARFRADLGLSSEICAGRIDRDGDGHDDASWRLEQAPGKITVRYDEADDGSVDTSYVFEYDATLRPTRFAAEAGGLEEVWRYGYDGSLADDIVTGERTRHFAYFQDGHIELTTSDGVGAIEEQRTIRRDADGRPMFEQADLAPLDGMPDRVLVRTFGEYGPLQVSESVDHVGHVFHYSYDEDGLAAGWTVDVDGDGVVDEREELTRDDDGRLSERHHVDVDRPGQDYTIRYTRCP